MVVVNMPKKKGFTRERYKIEIIEVLRKEPFMSTSEICDKLSMGFDTAMKYLNELLRNKEIESKERGNRIYWFLD